MAHTHTQNPPTRSSPLSPPAKKIHKTKQRAGGDISRKKKLLQKQADGKKRMKQIGRVEVPQAAFMAILTVGDGGGSD